MFIGVMQMLAFKKLASTWIGVSFFVSSMWLIVIVFTSVYNRWKIGGNRRKYKEELLKHIDELDPHEKAVFREFFIEGTYTLQLPVADQTVSGLYNRGILIPTSNVATNLFNSLYLPYKVQSDVWKKINNNTALIGFPAKSKITKKLIQDMYAIRPRWTEITDEWLHQKKRSRW